MTRFLELAEDLRLECQEDHVGLWRVVACLRAEGVTDPMERRKEALAVAEYLLAAGVEAGQFYGQEWQAWSLDPGAALKRIADGWKALGREPDLGDVVWFTAPD